METTIKIKIKTPKVLGVYDEEKYLEALDYDNCEDAKKEAYSKDFDEQFMKGIHEELVKEVENIKYDIKDKFNDGMLLEDYFIEGYEDLEDYHIQIYVEKQ